MQLHGKFQVSQSSMRISIQGKKRQDSINILFIQLQDNSKNQSVGKKISQ